MQNKRTCKILRLDSRKSSYTINHEKPSHGILFTNTIVNIDVRIKLKNKLRPVSKMPEVTCQATIEDNKSIVTQSMSKTAASFSNDKLLAKKNIEFNSKESTNEFLIKSIQGKQYNCKTINDSIFSKLKKKKHNLQIIKLDNNESMILINRKNSNKEDVFNYIKQVKTNSRDMKRFLTQKKTKSYKRSNSTFISNYKLHNDTNTQEKTHDESKILKSNVWMTKLHQYKQLDISSNSVNNGKRFERRKMINRKSCNKIQKNDIIKNKTLKKKYHKQTSLFDIFKDIIGEKDNSRTIDKQAYINFYFSNSI